MHYCAYVDNHLNLFNCCKHITNRRVGITHSEVTGCGLDDRDSISSRNRYFSLHHSN